MPSFHAFLGFAFGAIAGVDPKMPQPDFNALQRNFLAVGVKPQRHRSASAERRQQQIVRPRTVILATGIDRLIRDQMVFAGDDLLIECAAASFADNDEAGRSDAWIFFSHGDLLCRMFARSRT
jgi:hypothetical protein